MHSESHPAHRFKELQQSWWWFDQPKRSVHAENQIAWEWELLRRTKVYTRFIEDLRAYEAGKNRHSPVLPGPMREHDPWRRWPLLRKANCLPNLDWCSLTQRSRNILACNAPLFTHADTLPAFAAELEIDPVIVSRGSNGAEAFKSPGTTINAAIAGKHPALQILAKSAILGAYIVLIFDVRLGRSIAKRGASDDLKTRRLTKCLKDISKALLEDRGGPDVVALRSQARVLPSIQRNIAQAWIPVEVDSEPDSVQARFAWLLDPRVRRKWFPECLQLWNTYFCEPADFDEFPRAVKTKPAKAILNNSSFWVGFCAWDCASIERRVTNDGMLIQFLKKQHGFQSIAEPCMVADGLKRVTRVIRRINSTYCPSPKTS